MLMDPKWQEQLDRLKSEPWRTLLHKAADYIEEHGWCQGTLLNSGQVCTMGALYAATGWPYASWGHDLLPLIKESHDKLVQFLDPTINPRIDLWNDRAGRTRKEVIAALRGAAVGG